MMSISRTSDVRTIKDVIEPYYNLVVYDGCPGFEDFEPDTENALWFILKHKSDTAGLIKLDNLNLTTFMPHIVIKKEYRGNGSEQWGLLVVRYMQERIPDVNFLVISPYENAKDYALRMGFKFIGIIPNSIKKNGQLMDQYMLSGCPDINKSGEQA